MLEETARDRVDADGVVNAGDTGFEAVESRTTQSMRAPAWLARYKALMHFSLTSELHLVLIHAGCLPMRRSPCGVFDEAGAGVARAAERRLGRAPGSCLNRRVRSWSTAGSRVSGRGPSRLVVVVAGADVAVAAQAALLPTHDEWHGGAARRESCSPGSRCLSGLRLLPRITAISRAGPVECAARNAESANQWPMMAYL